jgi:hypothetical protein
MLAQNDGEEVVASNLVVGKDEPLNLTLGSISQKKLIDKAQQQFV